MDPYWSTRSNVSPSTTNSVGSPVEGSEDSTAEDFSRTVIDSKGKRSGLGLPARNEIIPGFFSRDKSERIAGFGLRLYS